MAIRLGVSVGVLMGKDEAFMDWYTDEEQDLLRNKLAVTAVKKALAELKKAMILTGTSIPK